MKNIFLFFVMILLMLILRETKTKEQIQVLDVNKTTSINFNGKMFLPRTLPWETEPVNDYRFYIKLAGKDYHYVKQYGRFTLEQNTEADEITVRSGDSLKVSGKTKLIFAKELL